MGLRGGWEAEFDDDEYNFSLGVMTGAADEALPSIFEGGFTETRVAPSHWESYFWGYRMPAG